MGFLLQRARSLGIAPVRVELMSPLPLNECVSRLRAAISPFGSLLVAGPVFGEITGTRLRARKHIVRRGGFQSRLVADLIENGGHTLIECRFTVPWWELCFALGGLSVLFVSWIRSPAEESAMILPVICLSGFGVMSTMLYLAREERRFLIDFLTSVVDAREVQVRPETTRPPTRPAAE